MQKFKRVDNYLQQVDEETDMAATKPKSSIKGYSYKLKLTQDMLKKYQGANERTPRKRKQAA